MTPDAGTVAFVEHGPRVVPSRDELSWPVAAVLIALFVCVAYVTDRLCR